jgi:hypothetical protein
MNPHKHGRPTLIGEDLSQLIEEVNVRAICIHRAQRIIRVARWRAHQVSAGVG